MGPTGKFPGETCVPSKDTKLIGKTGTGLRNRNQEDELILGHAFNSKVTNLEARIIL